MMIQGKSAVSSLMLLEIMLPHKTWIGMTKRFYKQSSGNKNIEHIDSNINSNSTTNCKFELKQIRLDMSLGQCIE